MDTVLRIGFENVTHKITFQPQTETKGKLLVKANHVQKVEEHRRNGKGFIIIAQVIRQTSVTSTPYNAKICVSHNKIKLFLYRTYAYDNLLLNLSNKYF